MSPSALALAVLLHAFAVLALWWMSVNQPSLPPSETPVEVTFEQPKPPEPPPPPTEKPPAPAEKPPAPPAPPIELGLRPPAAITADKPTQVPTPPQPSRDLRPPSEEQAVAPPQPAQPAPPPPPPPPMAAPEPPKPVLPSLPPQAHASLAPPPAKPSPPPPRPEFRPSPLTTPQRPPAGTRTDDPSPSPFVNPADVYNRARVADNYLWQVVSKLQGYHYYANVEARRGTTVVRVVIARDGRLLDVAIAQSSGYPAFDSGVLAGVRAGSPYAPLPPEIKGDRATFTLPLISVAHQ